jgi:hypothetical protein
MTAFRSNTDIGNRALQHCGANRMDPVLGFADTSVRGAAEIAFCYDMLREAELSRRVWTFATRRQVLRAIDTNTMKIVPALYSAVTTYFDGSIVADQSGNYWISRIANNLGNDPLLTTYWEPYFGPLTASEYDSTISYFAGEVVYIAVGDGTYATFLSLINGNSVDPSLPNLWNSTAIYSQNQVVEYFPGWAVGTSYSAGATVLYTDGNFYTSLTSANIGHIPPSSAANWILTPTLSLTSQAVPSSTLNTTPGSSPVVEWAGGTTYSLGSFVMFEEVEYVSIANANTGNLPNAAASTFWAAVSLGTLYMSLINLNSGNNPANAPVLWAVGTTYAAGNKVGGSDGNIYSSVGSGNTGNNPVTDAGVHWTNTGVLNPWTTVFTQGGGNDQWLQIGGAAFPFGVALTPLVIVYPFGVGPSSQSITANAFHLPAGYLRLCSQQPKTGVNNLGGPSGKDYNDWLIEGNLLVSSDSGPLPFRFITNFTDVARMHTMFCEGLAARVGLEVCETVTQSTAKLQTIGKIYDRWISEAGQVDAIEDGFEDMPDDELISVRY